MWDFVGIVRTQPVRLRRAESRIKLLRDEIRDYYIRHRVTSDPIWNCATWRWCQSLIVGCALQRQESRGLHFTLDHPGTVARKPSTLCSSPSRT